MSGELQAVELNILLLNPPKFCETEITWNDFLLGEGETYIPNEVTTSECDLDVSRFKWTKLMRRMVLNVHSHNPEIKAEVKKLGLQEINKARINLSQKLQLKYFKNTKTNYNIRSLNRKDLFPWLHILV